MLNKIKKNIINNNFILSKEDLEKMQNRCFELKDLIIDCTKKGQYRLAQKYSIEFASIVKKLKKYNKMLKKK